MALAHRLPRWPGQIWAGAISAGFLVLALQVGVTAFRMNSDLAPALIIVLGTAALGFWRPAAACFAFIALVFWLNGLSQAGLLISRAPVSLSFCSLWLGAMARGFLNRRRTPPDLLAVETSAQLRVALILTDVLITVILLSLVWQFARQPSGGGGAFSAEMLTGAGFGDPQYFQTAAFLWLQGLFFFRLLLRSEPGGAQWAVHRWVYPVMFCQGLSLVFFALFQYLLRIPTPYNNYAYYLPCEDISSFGSIAIGIFVFAATAPGNPTPRHRIFRGLAVLALGTLIIFSWSRATWLTAIVFLSLLGFRQLPRAWKILALAVPIAAGVFIAVNADRPSWKRQPYLARLGALARFEGLNGATSPRVSLYQRAVRMIAERPLTGHGIGSFYLTSVQYSEKNAYNAGKPDFAHNFLLQFAAELGLPAALLLTFLVANIIRPAVASAAFLSRAPPADLAAPADSALVVPTTLAILAYLLTQMSANSLNVYATNQFFFWFLCGALLLSRAAPRA